MADLLRYLSTHDRTFRMNAVRRIEAGLRPDPALPDLMRSALSTARRDEPGGDMRAKAVILLEGRPSRTVVDGSLETDDDDALWSNPLTDHAAAIARVLPSVARVDAGSDGAMEQYGTLWMLDDRGHAVTNRHVAERFARVRRGGGFELKLGPFGARMKAVAHFEDVPQEDDTDIIIGEITHIEGLDLPNLPDLAIVKLTAETLPPPIPLCETLDFARDVVSIGYPGFDEKHDTAARLKVFGADRALYGVKRVAPGKLWDDPAHRPVDWALPHDCSTLRGASGSLIADLETGAAVGVHFFGRFGTMNYAVTAKALKDCIAGAQVAVHWPPRGSE